jgi:hypothetical protein
MMLHSYIILPCYGIRIDYQKYHVTGSKFLGTECKGVPSPDPQGSQVTSIETPNTQVICQLQDHI